jgi:hypothetical protein
MALTDRREGSGSIIHHSGVQGDLPRVVWNAGELRNRNPEHRGGLHDEREGEGAAPDRLAEE